MTDKKKTSKIISGIQQIGVGVSNVHAAWKWYRENFGMDVKVFEEEATAEIMLPYTGGQPRKRHAILAINLQGGGGFEIWQYKERTPQAPEFDILPGDLGIYAAKLKSLKVAEAFDFFNKKKLVKGNLCQDPNGFSFFYVKDAYGNIFQVVQGDKYFAKENKPTGAVYGAIVGVTDIEKSKNFYSEILGYDTVLYDKEGTFQDLNELSGTTGKYRRVLLTHNASRRGAFSKLLGSSQIELIQALDRKPRKIFENRLWGDLGFIHLCYDVHGMSAIRKDCEQKGYFFTVDSSKKHASTFDMGDAAGQFSYIEDPDGTLIEFVETHKVPISKRLGLFINLRKRNPEKSLPSFLVKAMRFNKVKE
jgi:catechol 2,3-dioxygenase-like lactoylglutathione lyase family enzyme